MTEQYLPQSINSAPSAISFIAQPTVDPAAGAVSTEAFYWSTLAADSQSVGDGISVAGDANAGSILQFSAPGLYQLTISGEATPPGGFNIVRGATLDITAVNGYPAVDFAAGAPLGVIALVAPGASTVGFSLSATFRISAQDLEDPTGGINPNRQVRFAALPGEIIGVLAINTQISAVRLGL